jgi:hypothetical protein
MVEMDHGQRATERHVGQCLVTVRAASGESSTLGMALVMVLSMGSPPPSSGLMRGALIRRIDDESIEGYGGSVFAKNYRTMAGLFMGVLTPMNRGLSILTNLSRNRLQITVDKEKSERG